MVNHFATTCSILTGAEIISHVIVKDAALITKSVVRGKASVVPWPVAYRVQREGEFTRIAGDRARALRNRW